jgi:hypothetical protein
MVKCKQCSGTTPGSQPLQGDRRKHSGRAWALMFDLRVCEWSVWRSTAATRGGGLTKLQDAAVCPYKGCEDIQPWATDAVKSTLKSSEEAAAGAELRDRSGAGLRTGPAVGRRRSEHGRGDATCDC